MDNVLEQILYVVPDFEEVKTRKKIRISVRGSLRKSPGDSQDFENIHIFVTDITVTTVAINQIRDEILWQGGRDGRIEKI